MSILVNTGFKVGGAEPLNEYSVRETLDDRDDLVTNGYVYEGMEVYCKDTKIKYRWNGAAWDILDDAPTDVSTHKTTIYENHIDMGKYMLLAKITNANYTNNIIKFSCPNYKGSMDVGFKYEDDMDIYKFELHFNTGSRRENNGYGVTLKQHGLGLYSYPLNNPKNTEPKIEEAIRLYWDYSKGEIYVFLVDTMTAIPHCVLEYTGSGILLRDNTFVMDDLYNRREGLNGTWEESKWKSIPFNKLEIPPIYELGGGSAEGMTTVTSIEDLGLTAPVTVGEIFNAMPNKTMAVIACEEISENPRGDTVYVSDVPMAFGILTIKKNALGRFSIEYQNSLQGSPCNVKRWIGTLKGLDGTGLYWKELQAENGEIITSDTITKYGTEILKYPVGTWRIDSTNIADQFTDLPLKNMGAVIEIDSINPNVSPYGHRYGYRNYIFKGSLDNIIYVRTLSSGDTANVLNRDTGWRKVCTGINYSTTEQAVGTWIDGSTLYRKVFIIDSVAAQTTEADVEICNLGFNTQKRIIKLNGTVNSIGNDGFLPYAYYPNCFQFFSYLQDDSVYFKGTWKYPLNSVRIILEYIK